MNNVWVKIDQGMRLLLGGVRSIGEPCDGQEQQVSHGTSIGNFILNLLPNSKTFV